MAASIPVEKLLADDPQPPIILCQICGLRTFPDLPHECMTCGHCGQLLTFFENAPSHVCPEGKVSFNNN